MELIECIYKKFLTAAKKILDREQFIGIEKDSIHNLALDLSLYTIECASS
jgi:hypothetical protein